MLETYKKEWGVKVAIWVFLLLTIWWVVLFFSKAEQTFQNYLFGATYGIIALWGGVWGINTSLKWGGLKSVMGKAIFVLSFGLLAEEFGQIVFSYYNIASHVEIPYPSLADVGFFGNIPFYLFGMILLAQASGVQFTLQKLSHKIQIVVLPIAMLVFSYFLFLQQYTFYWTNPVKIFLDFGYPLGQALYVSVALLTYSLSRNILGGIMKPKIFFLIIAFVAQYLADFNFLFQNSRGTWINGGYGDYLYLVAYFLMTIGLIQLNTVYRKLKN